MKTEGIANHDYLLFIPTNHGKIAADIFGEDRNYDVALNDYTGDGIGTEKADHQFALAGHKWPCISRLPLGLLKHYKAVAFFDDDIDVTTDQMNALFVRGTRNLVDIWQASLPEGYEGWQHLNHQQDQPAECRTVPMVEIMMPIFSRRALCLCWPTFSQSESGYGLDFWWAKILADEQLYKPWVFDSIIVDHVRPTQSHKWKLSTGETPHQEWARLAAKYGFPGPSLESLTPPPPMADTAKPTIFLVMPHGHNPEMAAAQRLWQANCGNANIIPFAHSTSALPRNFNILWSMALAMRDKGQVTHFAMLHDDVVPHPDDWLAILLAELGANDADLISAAVAIKDYRGLSSTGIEDPGNPWNPAKRLTMKEIHALPETFSAADCGWPDRALLVNTGCWMADLRRPIFRPRGNGEFPLYFTMNDRIVHENGLYRAQFEPEDWFFSRLLHKLGGRVLATRKVSPGHVGKMEFPSDCVWGELQEDNAGTIAELRALADKFKKSEEIGEISS
jgi:hypothetical protein